eukprot:Blabericola_migrator_1__4827@NODE_2534_length_2636_cov_43_434021_g1585_i0_p4_GENE_NODE_2534_length_2636_cov_43_434021_g1585_i0NODE_2534_length_2636_cov_43_434021_g1585_i0_p4_ORF_typecomplete_len110_score0_357TM_GPCR_Srv/PF10323_9/0_027_NODE_2534_length_2636_cov_43_434021_g1585_i022472576
MKMCSAIATSTFALVNLLYWIQMPQDMRLEVFCNNEIKWESESCWICEYFTQRSRIKLGSTSGGSVCCSVLYSSLCRLTMGTSIYSQKRSSKSKVDVGIVKSYCATMGN